MQPSTTTGLRDFPIVSARRPGSVLKAPCVFLTLTLFTTPLLHAQSTPPSANEMEQKFDAAIAAQERGDLKLAESLLQNLRQQHPGIFAVDESLGLLYVQQERFEEAIPLLKAAAHDQPDSDAAHANLGAAWFRLKQNQQALAEFQIAARLNPKNSATQESLGRLLMEAHQPAQAADAFAAAIALSPANHDLVLDRAQALKEAGRPADSIAALNAMPGVEQSAAAQSLLGEAEEKLGAYQKAATHFLRAADLDPTEANIWAVGVEFLRHWTFEPAISEFEAGAQKYPSSNRMQLGLGAAYFGGARYASAIPVFAGLLNSDPNSPLYAELLGMACAAVSESAKQECNGLVRYAETHPRDAKVSTFAASMLLTETQTGDRAELARRFLDNALAVAPKSPEAHYQRGVFLQNQGDWAGSVSDLETAIALKPDFSQAHYRLALAYWRVGRKQQGQAEMELQKKYSKQEKEDRTNRMRQITTFIVDVQK